MARARGIKQPHPLVSVTMARARGIKQRHPLGSVRSRSGVTQLTAESGITTSGLPGVKISALPAAGAANDSDQFEVNQAGTSRRVTVTQLVAAVAAGNGTVTSTSVVSANGLAGTVATPTTTPALTLSTTVNGMVKGNGTALSAAVAGTDYAAASHSHIAGDLPAYPTTLPPNGAAGGDLGGSYPNPTAVKASGAFAVTGALTGTTATFTSYLGVGTTQSNVLMRLRASASAEYPIYATTLGGAHLFSVDPTGNVYVQGNLNAVGTVFAPGAQLQMVSTQTGAVATGTTVIPVDDTIPQITEGDQYMTLAITPRSATSKLVIEVVCHVSSSTGGALSAALFQDSTANALAASIISINSAGQAGIIAFRHTMTSGTTSATTLRVRAGMNAAGTTTFNGGGGARFFGGVIASSIVIREVAV